MGMTKFSTYAEQRALGAQVRDAGISRYEVARSLGVSPSTVGGWLSGYNRMPPAARAVVEYRLRELATTTNDVGGAA